jgi:hypothetical protein
VPAQYALNSVTVTVPGSGDTKVYAASTSSTSLVPITTNNGTAGTAITLPYTPNSIVADPAGKKVYLGSSTALMQVDVATGTVTNLSVVGNVLAVSPDSNYAVVSNSAGAVYVVNVTTATTTFQQTAVSPSAAFTADSKTSWFFNPPAMQAFADSLSAPFIQFPLDYVPNAVAFNGTSSLAYVTSSSSHEVDVRSTCDRSRLQILSANDPTLVATIPNGSGVVVADSPNIDVITSTSITGGCPTTAINSIANFNLGAGSFNATQLFLSSDSSHAWLITDHAQLLGLNLSASTPIAIPFANGATPLSGGIRMDGQQIYIGASDGTVHRVDVASLTDAQQIAVGLKDSNGNAVSPNLVVVVP